MRYLDWDIRMICLGKRLFITAHGFLGLGPACVEPNDIICAVTGCQVAMVIRRQRKPRSVVVGACYVCVLTNGEAFRVVEEDDWNM